MKRQIVGLGLLCVVMSVGANDRGQEREELLNIIQELELVRSVVARVREEPTVDRQGVRFRYDSLDSRLAQLQRDIGMHIEVMDKTPRFERFQLLSERE